MDAGDRLLQSELLIDACEDEIARLADLRRHHAADAGFLTRWLDHDLQELEERRAWLVQFRDELAQAAA